ncbi:MAG TPA: PAS domain S-box protein, partial [Pseudomonas sp.]|nr:PAS domain S-box protein [Pseudomonas sp.]
MTSGLVGLILAGKTPAAVQRLTGMPRKTVSSRSRSSPRPKRPRSRALPGDLGVYQALIEYSTDFMGMADLQGRLLFVNRAGRGLVGLGADGPEPDQQLFDFLPSALRPDFRERILPEVLQTGHWEGEYQFRHFGSGASIPVQMSVFLVRDARTGQPAAVATVSRDLSGQRRTAAALQEGERRYQTLFIEAERQARE